MQQRGIRDYAKKRDLPSFSRSPPPGMITYGTAPRSRDPRSSLNDRMERSLTIVSSSVSRSDELASSRNAFSPICTVDPSLPRRGPRMRKFYCANCERRPGFFYLHTDNVPDCLSRMVDVSRNDESLRGNRRMRYVVRDRFVVSL